MEPVEALLVYVGHLACSPAWTITSSGFQMRQHREHLYPPLTDSSRQFLNTGCIPIDPSHGSMAASNARRRFSSARFMFVMLA
jgi:hypothetical protein